MTKKRGREDLSEALASPPISLPKRSKAATKLVSEVSSGSQATSNGDVIKDAEDHSREDEDEDDDYTSSSGTSSPWSSSDEEDQSDEGHGESIETDMKTHDDEEDAITYVPGRPKPKIQRTNPLEHSGLMSRISSFLPQLQAANVDLEQKLAAGGTKDMIMDDAQDDDEQYIEMNLGLGVLKEKRDDDSSDSQDDASNSDHEDHEDAAEKSESHIMDRLMGIKSRSNEEAPGIQEVEDG
ncbi:hypothetical protein PISL3812_00429 [Talaromyces islandicus]|uniref:Uncharacterized protein n=1 Tax=Talaromyces islandicus TaxID=28573 RepID=A0A0U1LLT4_TALIS|nr:hypothetical protein PISL3812_00429 [Talaromyces islandicus]